MGVALMSDCPAESLLDKMFDFMRRKTDLFFTRRKTDLFNPGSITEARSMVLQSVTHTFNKHKKKGALEELRKRLAEKVKARKLKKVKHTLQISMNDASFKSADRYWNLQKRNLERMRVRIEKPGEMNRVKLAASGFY